MRRRATGQRAVPRIPGNLARRNRPETTATVVQPVRRSSNVSKVGEVVGREHAATGSHLVTPCTSVSGVADDGGDDQVPSDSGPVAAIDHLFTPCAPSSPAVAMRPAGDVPVPPPKRAA